MKTKRPRISVVLCTFNGADFVDQQLDSILRQTRLPDEVIVSDDCSTDATAQIVKGFADRHPDLISVVSTERNLGFVRNFTKAIGLATGDVVFLADQDDVWFEEKIETMVQPFVADPAVGLVYCDAAITRADLEPTGETLFAKRRRLRLGEPRSAVELIRGVGINGCTMVFRAELKALIEPVGPGWGHDHWIAFLAHAVAPVQAVKQPLMFYRRHGDSAGTDPFLEGGRARAWRVGAAAGSLDEYDRDLSRWEAMTGRLTTVLSDRPLPWLDYSRLAEFAGQCERRTKLARSRRGLKALGGVARLRSALGLAVAGEYHRYLRGLKSLAKDVFIR